MAIDRTKKWRCTWQSENGWANMLEIIPAGDMLAGTDLTVTTFGRAAFEMDFAEYGFDDLPFGMMKAPACSFSFDWRNLPSGLKELLAAPEYEAYTGYYTTTLFVFYSDEGLGGGYVLQYIGAQANTLGNKFTLSGASTVFKVQIETLDLLKTIMDVSRPSLIFEAATSTGAVINSSYATTIMQGSSSLDFATDTPSPHGLSKYDIAPQSYHLLLYSIAKIRDTIASELAVKLAYWNRAGLFGYEATVAQTQYPNAAIALYKQSLNTNHAKSTALDETNTLVLGHICELDSGTYFSRGGFFSNDAGKEGANEYDSFASFVTAFAENFLCKLKILPVTQVNGISGDTLLTYSMYWLKGWESTVSTITLSPKIIGNEYDITTAEKVFLIAEVETPNMKDKDVNLSRVAVTINDKADVWNVKAILHNSPTVADDEQNGGTFGIFTLNSSNSMGEAKLYPRKLYYTVSGANSLFKVHESVVITDGINTKTIDSPTALPTDWSLRNVQGWAITTQQTQGLQQAIAEYITENWSSRSQCLRDFTCKMVGGNSDGSIMPRHVGNRFTLPAISALGAGARSLLLTVKPDFDKGHITCKFLSIPD